MSVAPAASAPTPGPAGAPTDPSLHHAPRVDRGMLVVMLVLGLAALLIGLVWTRDLFPMTEVRGWLRGPWPVDWDRYLLVPRLTYGDARLTSVAVIQTVGRVCGLDTGCVNAAGSGLVALAVVLLVGHTRQLLRSVPLTIPVAVLWLLSAPVLNIWMWQSTWSDLVAFLSLMLVSSVWWWFGRPSVSRVGTVAFVLASLVLLAVAFNSKELLWVLAGVMPLLAVVRFRPGTLRRNLLACVLPLAWAASCATAR